MLFFFSDVSNLRSAGPDVGQSVRRPPPEDWHRWNGEGEGDDGARQKQRREEGKRESSIGGAEGGKGVSFSSSLFRARLVVPARPGSRGREGERGRYHVCLEE